MIKLLPDAVADIEATLTAVRETSKLLAGAPRQNYALAVSGALSHLQGQMAPPFGANSPIASLATAKDPMGEFSSLRCLRVCERHMANI